MRSEVEASFGGVPPARRRGRTFRVGQSGRVAVEERAELNGFLSVKEGVCLLPGNSLFPAKFIRL